MAGADHPVTTRTWSVEILLGERDGHTHAEARLHTGDMTPLTPPARRG